MPIIKQLLKLGKNKDTFVNPTILEKNGVMFDYILKQSNFTE